MKFKDGSHSFTIVICYPASLLAMLLWPYYPGKLHSREADLQTHEAIDTSYIRHHRFKPRLQEWIITRARVLVFNIAIIFLGIKET
ncbi:hypothetical protein EV127DRAFT_110665 [Xylaria flabelliformis]|nr:hypothetical protein EV127DRAFT_110665 [Xylaria flabelliformis]